MGGSAGSGSQLAHGGLKLISIWEHGSQRISFRMTAPILEAPGPKNKFPNDRACLGGPGASGKWASGWGASGRGASGREVGFGFRV